MKLHAHDLDHRTPERIVRGRVVDDQGKPVAGAEVWPIAIQRGNSTQFGGLKEVDALTVTNARGEFRLGVPENGMALYVQVEARNLARRIFPGSSNQASPGLSAGATEHKLELRPGVTVLGKAIKNGKPSPGIVVGLVQSNRNSATFLGEQKIRTDRDGQFLMRNVPAHESYVIYGQMDSCRQHGAIKARSVLSGGDGKVLDVGALNMEPGLRLTGRIMLSDQKPLPAGTRVSLSREQAWDVQVADVAADGTFSFYGLPVEGYTLSSKVAGYHFSSKNVSIDENGFCLTGRIEKDISGLRVLLEPGANKPHQFTQKHYEEAERRRSQPIEGAPNLAEKLR
jgi:hypothetical protein